MIKSIRVLNADPYRDMKEAALKTMGLKMKKGDVFSANWIINSIISRHTHIRCVVFRIEFETTKPVRDQLLRSRHDKAEPYVCSQRPDRTGKERDPNELSTWYHDFSIEGLVKMCGDRLCTCTEVNTRKEIENLKEMMIESNDRFISTVGFTLIPNCGIYNSCKEFNQKNCFKLVNNGDYSAKSVRYQNRNRRIDE